MIVRTAVSFVISHEIYIRVINILRFTEENQTTFSAIIFLWIPTPHTTPSIFFLLFLYFLFKFHSFCLAFVIVYEHNTCYPKRIKNG